MTAQVGICSSTGESVISRPLDSNGTNIKIRWTMDHCLVELYIPAFPATENFINPYRRQWLSIDVSRGQDFHVVIAAEDNVSMKLLSCC